MTQSSLQKAGFFVYYSTYLILKLSKDLFISVALVIVLALAYYYGYEQYLSTQTFFNHYANRYLAQLVAWLISLFGYDTSVVFWQLHPNLIVVDGTPTVSVGTPCNGISLMYLFAAFVIAYPGPWLRKAWFIPLGLLFIQALNISRIMALAFVFIFYRSTFDFNHKYAFLIAVYALMGSLWLWWAFYLSNPEISLKSGFRKLLRFQFIKELI